MRNIKKIAFLGMLVGGNALTSPLMAEINKTNFPGTKEFSMGLKVGTLGLGGEIGYQFNPTFGVRFTGNWWEHFRETFRYDNVTYKKVRFRPVTFHLLGDWYFLKGWWRLTGGFGYTGTRIRLNRDMSNEAPPKNFLGNITVKYRYKRKISPYIGTGFDIRNLFGSKAILTLDGGVYFQGPVKGKATATGPGKHNPQLMSELGRSSNALLNKVTWVKTYPVISLGIRYPF